MQTVKAGVAYHVLHFLLPCAVLRFEADVEKFVRQGGQQDLTFDATLTGYQVEFTGLGELEDRTTLF